MSAGTGPGRGRWWIALGALGLGLVLVVALVVLLGLDPAALLDALARIGPGPLAVAFATVVVHAGCSALKWALVARRIDPSERRGWTFYLGYTTVAGVLAQVLTVHVSSIVVREVAVRTEGGRAFEGAGASLIEQVWDLAVLLVFAVATGLWLAIGGPWWVWMLSGLVLGTAAILPIQAVVRPQAVRLGTWLGRWPGPIARVGAVLAGPEGGLALDPALSVMLWGISLVRYAAMGVRAVVVAGAVGLPVAAVLQAFTVVQASQILSLTPGNLGISEWTWAGVLAALGHPATDAAVLALVMRALTVGGFVVLALAVMGLRLARRSHAPA